MNMAMLGIAYKSRIRSGGTRCSVLLTSALCLVWPGSIVAAGLELPPAIRNPFRVGGAATAFNKIGVDSAGNVYLAGIFIGAVPFQGFPVVGKTVLGMPGGYPVLYVTKISPSGDQLLHLTEIQASDSTSLGGMVVLADGSVVLAGGTQAPDFPTTAGSYQPRASNGGAFLLKLDASGEKLVFSTLLGDRFTFAASVAVGPDGSYYVGGSTNGKAFPTTAGAYQQILPAGVTGSVGFVSKISADGTKLLVSTLFADCTVTKIGVDAAGAIHFVGALPSSSQDSTGAVVALDAAASRLTFEKLTDRYPLLQVDGKGNSYVVAGSSLTVYDPSGLIVRQNQMVGIKPFASDFAVLADGTAVLVGNTSAVDFRTRNSLQPCNMNLPHVTVPVQWWVWSAALVVMDPIGTVVNASFLGGGAPAGYGNDANGIDSIAKGQGELLYVAGHSTSLDFPSSTDLIVGSATPQSRFGLTLDLNALPRDQSPSPACLAFSAPFGPIEAPVVPAMFMTLFGSNLGPLAGVSAQVDSASQLPTELAGVMVTAGGLAAPLLYVQDQQINFLVPRSLAGPDTIVCVSRAGMQGCLYAYVGDSDGAWVASVLNEDGTVNSPANRAPMGSVVSFFGIGFGVFDPATADGAPTSRPFSSPHKSVHVNLVYECRGCPRISLPATVEYFGTAPGLLNGVVQLNVRLPSQTPLLPTVSMSATVGGSVPAYPLRAPLVLVYVK
jgi:uncharacterized protein (TIGR03437 family)